MLTTKLGKYGHSHSIIMPKAVIELMEWEKNCELTIEISGDAVLLRRNKNGSAEQTSGKD